MQNSYANNKLGSYLIMFEYILTKLSFVTIEIRENQLIRVIKLP